MTKTQIFINYDERYESGGEVCKGDEDSPYPNYEDTFMNFSVHDITLTNTSPYHEEFTWAGDVPEFMYVVYVRYYDGDTFGTTCGKGQIVGAYRTSEEADDIAKDINAGKSIEEVYCVWFGYFSDLESVEVVKVPVVK
jgi:hypothetical protein